MMWQLKDFNNIGNFCLKQFVISMFELNYKKVSELGSCVVRHASLPI